MYNLPALYLGASPAKALPLRGKAVSLKADYTEAWFGLGQARLKLGDQAGARTAWQKVLQLEPGDAGLRA